MKFIILIVIICTSISSVLGQWIEITPNSSAQWFNSASFTDNNYGFVVGRYWNGTAPTGLILKTTDGGITWDINYTDTMPELRKVFFTNNSIGYTGGDGGKLYKTVDGGNNWQYLHFFSNEKINDIFFLNNDTGYISIGKKLYRTIDGGFDWTEIYSSWSVLLSVLFLDYQTGFVGGCVPNSGIGPPDYPTIHATFSGNSWVSSNLSGNYCLSSVSFPTPTRGFVMGSGGTFAHSMDGGNSWLQNNVSSGYGVNSMVFIDTLNGYAAGRDYDANQRGFIIKTSDGGNIWIKDLNYVTQALNDIFFPTEKVGYAVGGSGVGVILKLDKGTFNNEIDDKIDCLGLINILPNPVTDNFRLIFENNTSKAIKINIFNPVGQLMYASEITNTGSIRNEIDVSNLNTGIYLIQLISECQIITKKLIIN